KRNQTLNQRAAFPMRKRGGHDCKCDSELLLLFRGISGKERLDATEDGFSFSRCGRWLPRAHGPLLRQSRELNTPAQKSTLLIWLVYGNPLNRQDLGGVLAQILVREQLAH